ncbi:MAG: carboxypeptidase-like regulatory domain-containing protein [Bacteroidetes bacterium]|nr:carboxypeptidase-like regulatory domain-containing protein [Bacteroidota bacterium]
MMPAQSVYQIAKRLSCAFFMIPSVLAAQEVEVQGKVTSSSTGDPIPYASVVFKGTTEGVSTDFDGNYKLHTKLKVDSITVTSIGYKIRTKPVSTGKQVIDFQLEENTTTLSEFVFVAGDNPAFEILRNVIKNKNHNDKRKLSAYEYDSYTKTEIDINQISEKLRKRKAMRKIAQVLDSIDRVVGEDGKPILPLSISESVSKYYYRSSPALKTEHILKTKISGVGLNDGSTVSQIIGSSFQEYNFYQNWLEILSKNFVSPLADGWRLYYNYDLVDSVYLGNDFCYQLEFHPKSQADLTFTGSMWIRKDDFALKRIDVSVGKRANINFIDRIQLQQELAPTASGAWLPVKTRVLINIAELTKNSAGLLAKFYSSNKNFVVNQPHKKEFYEKRIRVAEDAQSVADNSYWDTLRHEPLKQAEKNVYQMIDTLKHIPVVRTYTEVFKLVVQGHYDLGKIEIGPYLNAISSNTVEGIRLQTGFRTNSHLSKKMTYSGLIGYGFQDHRLKYSFSVKRILNREHWTTVNFRLRNDIVRLGIDEEAVSSNPVFFAASRWGKFHRAYYYNEFFVSGQREFLKGLRGRLAFRNWTFNPTYPFGFNQQPGDSTSAVLDRFISSEAFFEVRYARDETFIQNGNERISLGLEKWPALTLRYTHGIKNVFGSNFNYDKVLFNIDQKIRMGLWGNGYMTLTGEYIYNQLPYPLLTVHLGNQASTFSPYTFNLMNYGEFASDESVSMHYRHYFEGLLLNRIPLMNRLKWRLVGTANVIYGSLRKPNQAIISDFTPAGDPSIKTNFFTANHPYVELGYGVENIFKFFRVDFVHRMTYLDSPNVRRFGVLFTAQFRL